MNKKSAIKKSTADPTAQAKTSVVGKTGTFEVCLRTKSVTNPSGKAVAYVMSIIVSGLDLESLISSTAF